MTRNSHSSCLVHRGAFATLLALALQFVWADRAEAQQQASNLPMPRLLTVSPAGAKIGTTVEVTFTGTDVEEPDQLLFSNPAIKAEPVIPPVTPPDPKKPPMPMAKPVITKFKVTVPANVPVGHHDVRLVNKWGISNPRNFVIGDLDEAIETEPNNDVPQPQKVALNSTINGSMASPTDVDYFQVPLKKGQRVICSCLASSIDSRFHPTLQLFDSKNRLLEENRNYQGTDALLEYTAKEDGDVLARVSHFTHTQGNQEYFYRLSISTTPWIDMVYPPVVEAGKPTQVTIYGRNLPGGQPDPTAVLDGVPLEKMTMQVTPPTDAGANEAIRFNGYIPPPIAGFDGFEVRVKNAAGSSNGFLLTYAKAPVILEKEPNDTAEAMQTLTVPCELAGRVDRRNDKDFYAFTAKKGDVLVFDLASDRLGVDSFMYFILRSEDGKQTFSQQEDGSTDVLSFKFYARTDDPAPFKFVVPADGKYHLIIGNRTGSIEYGPRHVYRMRIAPEQPDFRLFILGSDSYRPGTTTVAKSGHEQFTVFAMRQDGFAGDITLSAEGLPKGVTCPTQVLGGGLRHTQLVLAGAADAADWTGEIKIKGTATIAGKPVTREARAAGITWPIQPGQQFPRVARLERGVALAVRGQAPYSLIPSLDKPSVVQGTPVVMTVKLNRNWADFKQPLNVQANVAQGEQSPPSMPQGMQIANTNINPGQNEAKINLTIPANVPPGTYNLVLRSSAQIPYNKDPKATAKPNTPVVQCSAPVTLTIIPKTLATLSLANANVTAKVGAQAEVIVRVARQFDFQGEFDIAIEMPPGVQGLTIAPVKIPAGQSEAKLMVQVQPNAAPGNRANINIKATAMFDKTPVVHEVKLNVNVTK